MSEVPPTPTIFSLITRRYLTWSILSIFRMSRHHQCKDRGIFFRKRPPCISVVSNRLGPPDPMPGAEFHQDLKSSILTRLSLTVREIRTQKNTTFSLSTSISPERRNIFSNGRSRLISRPFLHIFRMSKPPQPQLRHLRDNAN